jgi:hypothetical protein
MIATADDAVNDRRARWAAVFSPKLARTRRDLTIPLIDRAARARL